MTVFFMYIILKTIKKTRNSLMKKKHKVTFEINIFKTVENIVRQKKQ